MQIQPINSQTNFKALIIPKNQIFTSEQQKIVDDIKNAVNKRYSNDSFKRTYIEFLESASGLDLVLKSNKDTNSVDMLIKKNRDKDALFLENFSQEKPVRTSYFSEYCDMFNENLTTGQKTLKAISGFILILIIIAAGAFINKSCSKSQKQTTEIITPIKDSLQKISKDTLDLTKQLIKK